MLALLLRVARTIANAFASSNTVVSPNRVKSYSFRARSAYMRARTDHTRSIRSNLIQSALAMPSTSSALFTPDASSTSYRASTSSTSFTHSSRSAPSTPSTLSAHYSFSTLFPSYATEYNGDERLRVILHRHTETGASKLL
eukprot:IDg7770t1